MDIRSALHLGLQQLQQSSADIALPHLEAQLLLSLVLQKPKEYLIAYGEEVLNDAQRQQYFDYIGQRAKGRPMAYLLGYKEFMGLNFFVDESVLIPRDDTEVLVNYVLKHIAALPSASVLNLGTGSGCIETILAKNNPDVQIISVDINKKALTLAKKNLQLHGVEDRVTLLVSDLFSALPSIEPFDVICSNPPYISAKDMRRLSTDVLCYEPLNALYGGQDGLHFYRRIAAEAQFYLHDGGLLVLEVGSNQSLPVIELLQKYGWLAIETNQDLQGHIRIVSAKKQKEPIE